MAEWLGGGLQNRLHWFESGRDLKKLKQIKPMDKKVIVKGSLISSKENFKREGYSFTISKAIFKKIKNIIKKGK